MINLPPRKSHRTRRPFAWFAALLAVLALTSVVTPATADVSITQQAIGRQDKKYVADWTNYGPGVYYTLCGGRTGCQTAFQYWRVSRGTATVRMTTFYIQEEIKKWDYFLLDVDVTTSGRSGTGDGGSPVFRIHSSGTTLYDYNDSKSIVANSSACSSVNVSMSTPWPIISASATVGHAELCDASAKLSRTSSSAAGAAYTGTRLADIRHLTMQRWVKVKAGATPKFAIDVVLPTDACTKGNGDGQCVAFSNRSTTKTINIGTAR